MNRLEELATKKYKCVGANSLFYNDTLVGIWGEDTIEDRPLELEDDIPGEFRKVHDLEMVGYLNIDKIVHANKTDTYLELKSKNTLLDLIDDLKEIILIIGKRMNTNRRYHDTSIPGFESSIGDIRELREELINKNKNLVEEYYNKPQETTVWDILPGINLTKSKATLSEKDRIKTTDVINEIKDNDIYGIARKNKYGRRK